MSSFPRPHRLESFTTLPVLAGFGLGALLLCTAACPASSGKDEGKSKINTAKPPPVPDKSTRTKPGSKKTTAPPPTAADDGCCRYCFGGTPCGDACIDEGETCDADKAEGCACAEDERQPKQFSEGWMPRGGTGILGPDVWNFNKAQGDPIDGPFTLEMAFEGAPELADKSKGTLTAVFNTSMGTFECELHEDEAPLTVANFVGLARGVRPFKDPKDPKSDEWTTRRYYDGTTFHRVIEGFMIQGGDPTASGKGIPGYFIPDEFDPELRHKSAGMLSMANRNPYDKATNKPIYDEKTGLTVGNTGSAQFFVTVAPTRPLDDRHTIFGKCETEVPIEISKVRVMDKPIPKKPFEDVTLDKLEIVRK